MSLLTNWGYALTDLTTLNSLLSVADFNTRTANKYSADTRLSTMLASVSQIIRDYAGWHLYPSAACEIETSSYDNRVSIVRNDILIQLPARFVSTITAIMIDDEPCTKYFLESNGLLRVIGAASAMQTHSKIKVKYSAGLSDALADSLKDIVVHKTIKSLVSSNGVQSETVGGVSISYNAAYMHAASGSALSLPEEAAMSSYRLRGVF